MLTRTVVCPVALLGVILLSGQAVANPEEKTVDSATTVLRELATSPMRKIPASLLAEAHGVVIVPGLIKVGLVVGGERGKGILVVKERDGRWRAPTFITLTGGSVGFQIGAQSTDIVLIFKTQRSVDGVLKGKFTIGADAAAAAGPVGRRVEAATDTQLKAEILSYSRSRGLFAGVSLDGTSLQIDGRSTAAYYGPSGPGQIVPESANRAVELIAQLTGHPEMAPPPAVNPQPAPAFAPPPMAVDPERLRRDLARESTQLSGRLDDAWRRYLALPAEVYHKGYSPPLPVLATALSRYDAIAVDPQFRVIAGQREFQRTRELLRAYIDALSVRR